MDKKTAPITVRLTPDTRKTLVTLAKRDGRSITNYIEWLISNAAKAAGDKR